MTALVVLVILWAVMGQRVLPACSGILAFSCGPPPPAGAPDWYELWIFIGQSNCAGNGNTATLPPPPPPYPQIPFSYRYNEPPTFESLGWVPLDGREPTFFSFGPEMTFALALEAVGRKPAILKMPVNGASLDTRWKPGADLYPIFLDYAREYLPAFPAAYRVAGAVWVGNEGDGGTLNRALTVANNLHLLAGALRSHFGVPRLPLLVSRLGTPQAPRVNFLAEVQAQQDLYVSQDPDSGIINTNDLVTLDDLHWNDPSTQIIGQRLAAIAPVP